MEPSTRRVVLAGAIAAVASGVPSTAWALLTGTDVLEATRAAGTLLPRRRTRPSVVGGAVAHLVISSVWTTAFALAARRWRLSAPRGAAAALGIAALDLEVIGRRYPAIAALPRRAHWTDHVVFGAVLGGVLNRGRGRVADGQVDCCSSRISLAS